MFVVDGSTKSDPTGWSSLLSFVSSAVREYQISRGVRVAFVQYSDRATTSIQLGQYNDVNSLVAAIGRIGQQQGTSNLATGLVLARSVLSGSGSRSRVVVVVTDQFQSISTITTAANSVRNSGILLVGVGVKGASGLTLTDAAFYSLFWNRVIVATGYNGLGSVVSKAILFACPGLQPWGEHTYICISIG